MKALVYEGPEILTIKDIPDVTPAAGEVYVHVTATGICGSDFAGYLGKTGRRIPPMVMGHEFGGVVEQLGEGVTDLKVGDRVSVYPVDHCCECEFCKQNKPMLCLKKKQYGVLTNNGSMTRGICVPARLCFKVPDHVTDAEAALVEPLAVSYRGVASLGDLTGKSVLVVGAGTIGLFALACVKAAGAAKIFSADMMDNRLEIAKKIGADVTINTGREDAVEVISKETDGKLCDCSVECVGITPTAALSIDAVGFGGSIAWIGNNWPKVEIPMQSIVTKEKKLNGSFLYSMDDFKNALQLIIDRRLDSSLFITKEIELEEAPAVFAELSKNPGNNVKVIIKGIE